MTNTVTASYDPQSDGSPLLSGEGVKAIVNRPRELLTPEQSAEVDAITARILFLGHSAAKAFLRRGAEGHKATVIDMDPEKIGTEISLEVEGSCDSVRTVHLEVTTECRFITDPEVLRKDRASRRKRLEAFIEAAPDIAPAEGPSEEITDVFLRALGAAEYADRTGRSLDEGAARAAEGHFDAALEPIRGEIREAALSAIKALASNAAERLDRSRSVELTGQEFKAVRTPGSSLLIVYIDNPLSSEAKIDAFFSLPSGEHLDIDFAGRSIDIYPTGDAYDDRTPSISRDLSAVDLCLYRKAEAHLRRIASKAGLLED